MKLIISDVQNLPSEYTDGQTVLYDNGTIKPCIGCFGCWIKTPGQCVIHDGYEDTGRLMSKCEELVLISRCTYGGLSPFVKNVLDRAISYISPHFVMRGGEMHHGRRYDNVLAVTAYFYGPDITEEERQTAQELVAANAVNYDGTVHQVHFLCTADEVKERLV